MVQTFRLTTEIKLSPSWQFKGGGGGKEKFKKKQEKKDEDKFVAVLVSLLKAGREDNGVVKDCGGWMDGSSTL